MSKSLKELYSENPSFRKTINDYLDYHRMREARPRIACPDCQFEYVEEEGHDDCGQAEISTQ